MKIRPEIALKRILSRAGECVKQHGDLTRLSKQSGLPTNVISSIIHNEREKRQPSYQKVISLCSALSLDPFTGEDQRLYSGRAPVLNGSPEETESDIRYRISGLLMRLDISDARREAIKSLLNDDMLRAIELIAREARVFLHKK